jgi:citrate synthase
MATLKEKFAAKIPGLREEIGSFVKANGDKVISEATVKQAYGGMRGIKSMVCDTSLVDPEQGLIIRGYPINDLTDMSAEAIFYLLLLGEKPTQDDED